MFSKHFTISYFKTIILNNFLILIFTGCSSGINYNLSSSNKRVYTGLENFIENHAHKYKGKKATLVTNHSGVDYHLRPNVQLLQQSGIRIVSVMAPEHGLYGYQNEYDSKKFNKDESFKLKIYNMHKLSGKNMLALFKKGDIVIFDIQDMGMRCYTYISNLKFIMDTLKGTHLELIVLDRPNPIGYLGIHGAYLDKRFESQFVSAFPSPFTYGMTIGESALYYRGEFAKNVRLTVIEMKGYTREMLYSDTKLPWIPPSPNLPTYESSIVYTMTVLMEGINLSLGRGTPKPFEFIGAPWIEPLAFSKGLNNLELNNFVFRPNFFEPTFSKYKGKKCGGVQIFYTGGAFDPIKISYTIILYIKQNYKEFQWKKYKHTYSVDFLAGTDKFRKAIDKGLSYRQFKKSISKEVEKYTDKRDSYLLYRGNKFILY